ncbi:MAG: hypothetical protein MJ187_01250, partial [Alphaproteobacteria bacterium]|nr:hypothetical protein [Alphaproteobacteria bacterium]
MHKLCRTLCYFTCIFGLFITANALAAGYTCDITYTSCNAGYYLSGDQCVICPAGYYCTGEKADKVACSGATKYQNETGKTSCKDVSSGYYKSSNSAQTQCPANYRNGAAASSEANCSLTTTAGNYVATAGSGQTACTAGYYCPGNTTIYYGGTHSSTHLTTGGN